MKMRASLVSLVRVLFFTHHNQQWEEKSVVFSARQIFLQFSVKVLFRENFSSANIRHMLKRPQHAVGHAKFKTTVSRPFPQQHGISSANML